MDTRAIVLAAALALATALAATCVPKHAGYYDAASLRYQGLAWPSLRAPDRLLHVEFQLYKRSETTPTQMRLLASTNRRPWRANASIALYASRACDDDIGPLESHHHASDASNSLALTANFTSHHRRVSCDKVYYARVTVAWSDGAYEASLERNGSTCIPVNACCLKAHGSCGESPHSACLEEARCLSSGNTVNASVSCAEHGTVCCVLRTGPPVLSQKDASPRPEAASGAAAAPRQASVGALSAYMLLTLVGLAVLGGAFLYHRQRRERRRADTAIF